MPRGRWDGIMTMKESIMMTANIYNELVGICEMILTYDQLIGKLKMYEDVTGVKVNYYINSIGKIMIRFADEERSIL